MGYTTKKPGSISDCLFYVDDVDTQEELEKYRKIYETAYGTTDLTKRYTSVWPDEQQEWLADNDPRAYFDGLPPFVKAFLKKEIKDSIGVGEGDLLPGFLVKLYMSGNMVLDHERDGPNRG